MLHDARSRPEPTGAERPPVRLSEFSLILNNPDRKKSTLKNLFCNEPVKPDDVTDRQTRRVQNIRSGDTADLRADSFSRSTFDSGSLFDFTIY